MKNSGDNLKQKCDPKMIQNEGEQKTQGIDSKINKTTFIVHRKKWLQSKFHKIFISLQISTKGKFYFVAAAASVVKPNCFSFLSRFIRLSFHFNNL